jgi:mevalonate pyrophosphate decarboxylase
MDKKVKLDMLSSRRRFVGAGLAASAASYAALSLKASMIRQEIILPEIICFRKVAL